MLPFAQTEAMFAAPGAASVPATLVRVPGGVHGQLSVPGVPDIEQTILDWLQGCLEGSAARNQSGED